MTTTPTPPENPFGAGSSPVSGGAQSGGLPQTPAMPPAAFPQYGDPYAGGFGAPPVPRRNGMGLTAMILGILSLPLAILFFPVAIVCGVLAIVFAVLGMRRVRRSQATNRGQAIAGLVCGVVGTVVSVVILFFAISAFKDCSDKYGSSGSQYDQCIQDKLTGNG